MSYDTHGQQYFTEDEMVNMLHINPDIDLAKVLLSDPTSFNHANMKLYSGYAKIKKYVSLDISTQDFDENNQKVWNMPDSYYDFDIITWLVTQCSNDDEITRVLAELQLYSDRNLIPLLQFLKYMIDTFRKENIIWGVGRGSSVSSYVLYLIGIHKINSLAFHLDIHEFLR